jgi:GNAT superfamily N-acetyltransferase
LVLFVVQIDSRLGVNVTCVLHFRKELIEPPVVRRVDEVAVRSLAIPDDLAAWLALRERAVAAMSPPVRPWTAADFFAEMVDKPWWRGERSWVVVSTADRDSILGSVTLALRAGRSGSAPVVHWLLVDPAWQRRGIGRLLMSHLERAAWDAGWREVQLETHAGWSGAVAFYHSMGYAPLRPRSPH